MPTSGSDTLANTLLPSILDGVSFPVPTVDLSDAAYARPAGSGPLFATVEAIGNDELTQAVVGGSGTFDVLMTAFDAHLRREYEAGRVTGSDYAKAYVELTQAAMANATQFLLGRQAAYWQALVTQQQAQAQQVALITGRVQLEIAKAQLRSAEYEALTNSAAYALAKVKLATEDITYGTAKYNLDFILPEQLKLVKEQGEVQRSQTLDTRSDGATVTGSVGKQKALYTQQIDSYKRDAEIKATKIFSDAWITMKTIDEGLLPPTGFENTNLDDILTSIKTNNGL